MSYNKWCSQTVEDSDFCPEDGGTLNADSSQADKKTPLFKKWWFWTMAVIAFNLSITAVLIHRKNK